MVCLLGQRLPLAIPEQCLANLSSGQQKLYGALLCIYALYQVLGVQRAILPFGGLSAKDFGLGRDEASHVLRSSAALAMLVAGVSKLDATRVKDNAEVLK